MSKNEYKNLGKITGINFGLIDSDKKIYGLDVQLCFGGGWNSIYCIKIMSQKDLIPIQAQEAGNLTCLEVSNKISEIFTLMQDAKVNYIHELIGKPVEVFTDNDNKITTGFRILTEVI